MTGTNADLLVPDASVLAALVFGEPRADEAANLLRKGRLVAPPLLRYELGNVARTKTLRSPVHAEKIRKAFQHFFELRIDWVEPDPLPVLGLAVDGNISYYDAAYLWVARSLPARLVTFDEKLARAAEGA